MSSRRPTPERAPATMPSHGPVAAAEPRPKSMAVLVVIGVVTSFLPLQGLARSYVGQWFYGEALFMANICAYSASRGELWAKAVQVVLWLTDVVGAAKVLREHNERLDAPAELGPSAP